MSRTLKEKIDRASKIENIDKSLDAIYMLSNTIFYKESYKEFDTFLLNINTDEYSTDSLLALLIISMWFRDKLSCRDRFYEETKKTLEKRPEWCYELIEGLQ